MLKLSLIDPRSITATLKPRYALCLALLCLAPVMMQADDSHDKEGAALFADKGCSHCHGPSGFGGSDTGPDLSKVRQELKAAEIHQQIHDGGNNMPPFGDVLTEEQITLLVEYLRSKRKPPKDYHPPAPAALPAARVKPDPD